MSAEELDALMSRAVEAYEFHHALHKRQRASATRKELKRVRELAAELFAWLNQPDDTAAGDAMRLIRVGASERLTDGHRTQNALREALAAFIAEGSDAERFTSDRKPIHAAPLIVAGLLWHGLPACGVKVTAYASGNRASPAVEFLVRVARAAGDKSLTLDAAKKALMRTKPTQGVSRRRSRP